MADIEKPQQPDIEWVKSPNGVYETYCNSIHPSWTLYDVRLQCGQLVPIRARTGPFVVEEKVAITMAWPQLKLLHKMLGDLLESYEQTNGEIKQLTITPIPAAGL
jgi:hypothetical protein